MNTIVEKYGYYISLALLGISILITGQPPSTTTPVTTTPVTFRDLKPPTEDDLEREAFQQFLDDTFRHPIKDMACPYDVLVCD